MSSKHTATTPDGQTITRNSKNRIYSHVVIGMLPTETTWRPLGWTGRFDLAMKLADQCRGQGWEQVQILEAEVV